MGKKLAKKTLFCVKFFFFNEITLKIAALQKQAKNKLFLTFFNDYGQKKELNKKALNRIN